jgi:hypothetical protein
MKESSKCYIKCIWKKNISLEIFSFFLLFLKIKSNYYYLKYIPQNEKKSQVL